jgi:hypothetical protein
VASNEGGNLKLHAQPTTLAPSQHTHHQLFHNNRVWDKGQKRQDISVGNLTTAKKASNITTTIS